MKKKAKTNQLDSAALAVAAECRHLCDKRWGAKGDEQIASVMGVLSLRPPAGQRTLEPSIKAFCDPKAPIVRVFSGVPILKDALVERALATDKDLRQVASWQEVVDGVADFASGLSDTSASAHAQKIKENPLKRLVANTKPQSTNISVH